MAKKKAEAAEAKATDDFALRRAQVERLLKGIANGELSGRCGAAISIIARKLDDDEIDDLFDDLGGAIDSVVSELENKQTDAEEAKEEAEARLSDLLSPDTCPLCGTALLSGETALDVANAARDCRGCRTAREREEEFHRRNPGVRREARATEAAARDPLAGIL